MGVLLPGSAHARPPLTLLEIYRHTCLQSHIKHLSQPIRSHYQSFGTLGQLFKMSAKIYHSAGGWGGPQFFWWRGILIFLAATAAQEGQPSLRSLVRP